MPNSVDNILVQVFELEIMISPLLDVIKSHSEDPIELIYMGYFPRENIRQYFTSSNHYS